MSVEARAAQRAKRNKRQHRYRQKKNAKMSALRAKHAAYMHCYRQKKNLVQKRALRWELSALLAYMQRYHQKKNASMSAEEGAALIAKHAAEIQNYRQNHKKKLKELVQLLSSL